MRWWSGVVGSLLLAVSSVSCGGGSKGFSSVDAGAVELPFGLEVVAGTVPIGRPAVQDEPALVYNGQPVRVRRLRAAFWVRADDPVGVVRAWVDQLDRLALDTVTLHAGDADPEQWMQVTGMTTYTPDEPSGDYADLELWATSSDPVLLVSIDKYGGEPHSPTVDDEAGTPDYPSAEVQDTRRRAGDELFTEQGDTLHLPDRAEALMPTIPTSGGTGGSTSVLAVADAFDAVTSLLDEAGGLSEYGEVTGPDRAVTEHLEVVTGSFIIPAGGWGFSVVAVRGADDRFATVYVTSAAD